MKTLGKAITLTFFKDQDSYNNFRKKWAKKMEDKEKIPWHFHILYLVLCGKDYRKSAAPTSKNAEFAFKRLKECLSLYFYGYKRYPMNEFSEYLKADAFIKIGKILGKEFYDSYVVESVKES